MPIAIAMVEGIAIKIGIVIEIENPDCTNFAIHFSFVSWRE